MSAFYVHCIMLQGHAISMCEKLIHQGQ